MIASLPKAVFLCGALLALAGTAVAAEPAADLARGKALYESKGCYQCHGRVGQGAGMTGPALQPMRLSPAALKAYVRKPAGVMPPYSAAILPDDEMAAITAYIAALPATRPASDIPLLAPFVKGGPADGHGPR